MDIYLINYELFKSRTGFNPYLLIDKGVTYEDFCKYLRRRKVNPPHESVFKTYVENKKKFLDKKVDSNPVIEDLEEVLIEKQVITKRKRRKKNKSDD